MSPAGTVEPVGVGTAALRMYDLPQIRPAIEHLWSAIAERLPNAPPALTWTGNYDEHWLAPDLAVGQTCTWPLATELADRVTPVGAFRYRGIEASPGARYRSVLVARSERPLEHFAGRVGAVSAWHSTSGWLSLAIAMAEATDRRPVFDRVVVSGGHGRSLELLRECAVDIASIDRVTFRLFERHHPESVAGLTIVGDGPLVPTLPLISARPDPSPIRAAIAGAVADDAMAESLDTLMIEEFFPIDAADVATVLSMAEPADAAIPRSSGSDSGSA